MENIDFELKVYVSVQDTYITVDIEKGYATTGGYFEEIKDNDDISKVVAGCVKDYVKTSVL